MTPEQFAYWLQGYVEIRGSAPTSGEWDVIKDHLATVFNKVTPNRSQYPSGPAIAEPYRGEPVVPNPWINPVGPYVTPPIHWTTPPNWPRPEVICSTQQEPMPTNLRAGGYYYSNAINAAGGSGFNGTEIKL